MKHGLRFPALLVSKCVTLVLTGFTAAGQASQSQIDLVRTDAQVEHLVRQIDKYYANFKVSSALRFADKRVERQYRKAGVKAWAKADFDGNGRLDLLITGTHYDDESKVICLMDMGDKLIIEPFYRQSYRACPTATVSYANGHPIIDYVDFSQPFLNEKLGDKQSFRLIYKFGGFIEHISDSPAAALPDSILYSSDFAYHSVEEEKMTLDAAGHATFYSCTYPVLDETKKTIVQQEAAITSESLRTIQGIAGYMANQHFKPTYRVGQNHVPYTTLIITYRNGQRLCIRDKGEIGTFSLMRLYELLGQLRKNQSWQSAKP